MKWPGSPSSLAVAVAAICEPTLDLTKIKEVPYKRDKGSHLLTKWTDTIFRLAAIRNSGSLAPSPPCVENDGKFQSFKVQNSWTSEFCCVFESWERTLG